MRSRNFNISLRVGNDEVGPARFFLTTADRYEARANGHNNPADEPLAEALALTHDEVGKDNGERNLESLHCPHVGNDIQSVGEVGDEVGGGVHESQWSCLGDGLAYSDTAVLPAQEGHNQVTQGRDAENATKPKSDVGSTGYQSIVVEANSRQANREEGPAYALTASQRNERSKPNENQPSPSRNRRADALVELCLHVLDAERVGAERHQPDAQPSEGSWILAQNEHAGDDHHGRSGRIDRGNERNVLERASAHLAIDDPDVQDTGGQHGPQEPRLNLWPARQVREGQQHHGRPTLVKGNEETGSVLPISRLHLLGQSVVKSRKNRTPRHEQNRSVIHDNPPVKIKY